MSDKLKMKLVIDEVSTPLLYARLLAARSPRERAALLRSLAETGLRNAVNGENSRATRVASSIHVATELRAEPQLGIPIGIQSYAGEPQVPAVSAGSSDDVHDTDALADQFGSFF